MTIEERLARVEKILDARGLDWDHPKIAEAKAEQQPPQAKPKRWRILDDKEIIQVGEWYNAKANKPRKWPPHGGWHQLEDNDICIGSPAGNLPNLLWCREVTDDAEPPKPAWEPKVGDWVKVTRPQDWKEWKDILWRDEMHVYDGKVFQVKGAFETLFGHRVKLHGVDWFFHRDWLSPSIERFAEPPAIDKPAEPEYREPVLPADAGKEFEFSDDGNECFTDTLIGFSLDDVRATWEAKECLLDHARIKKDA